MNRATGCWSIRPRLFGLVSKVPLHNFSPVRTCQLLQKTIPATMAKTSNPTSTSKKRAVNNPLAIFQMLTRRLIGTATPRPVE